MSVGRSGVGRSLQELRKEKGLSQQQMSFDLNVSRESVSAYETGRARVPKDISRKITEKFDDPLLSIQIRREYTGVGPILLDGKAVDMHRSSVKLKTLEEVREAKNAILQMDLVNKPEFMTEYEKDQLKNDLVQVADAITGLENFLVVICKEYNLSSKEIWDNHARKLLAKRYATKESVLL